MKSLKNVRWIYYSSIGFLVDTINKGSDLDFASRKIHKLV